MLSKEDNERITRVGPGTPMGTLMREYWVPAMLSRELPSADSDPVRVLLLGEKLIAFRDSSVAVGVLRDCNWLQALEGDIDTSHLSFLHHGAKTTSDYPEGTFAYYAVYDRAPRYQVVDTDYGSMYAAYRPAGVGQDYWRYAQFLFP